MHFYFIFDTGHAVSRSCVDWAEARALAPRYAEIENAEGMLIVWKAGGEDERWEKSGGEWRIVPPETKLA